MCDVPFSDKNHFDAKSDLIESFLTRDTSIVYSLKIDSFLEEFVGKLVHIDPISPGIDETSSNPKDDICFIEQLLYDDTSSEDDSFKDIDYVEASPPDYELVSLEEVKDEILRAKLLNIHIIIAKIKSLNNNPLLIVCSSLHPYLFSLILIILHPNSILLAIIQKRRVVLTSVVMNDIPDNSTNDPLMDEIDLFLLLDNSIPPGIENVNYDSEGDFLFLKELLKNKSLHLLEFESFHFDLYDDPSSSRLPEKPPDDGGILTTKVVDDISDNSTRELYVRVLNVLPSLPTLCLSHRGFKVFQLVNNYESPVMIYGENIPHLDVSFLYFYPT
uniref:Reverse transcriptase domain-containing protein n=1 Tax=Tanacetum cinerariifolium TaxID=118510 RepID=A0A6L2JBB0_TANCI|nr:hypothetical protein [Tanacetum cinerariifolium]